MTVVGTFCSVLFAIKTNLQREKLQKDMTRIEFSVSLDQIHANILQPMFLFCNVCRAQLCSEANGNQLAADF